LIPAIRMVDQSNIPARERQAIRYYAVLWIVGRMLALYWLYAAMLPLVHRYSADLAGSLARYSQTPADFWDALTLTVLVVCPLLLGVILWIRNLVPSVTFSRKRGFLYE
jgi:putative peptide zinc metalloprotease protein